MIDDAAYDIRYYSPNNFTGKRIQGYKAPKAYVTKAALDALSKAAQDLRNQGYRLLIWDAYRPQKAVDNFVVWINDSKDAGDKDYLFFKIHICDENIFYIINCFNLVIHI